jgi:uncharacterized caspase-like protein
MKAVAGRVLALTAACGAVVAFSSCSFEAPKITAPRYALVYGVSTYQSNYLEATNYYPYVLTNPQPTDFNNLSYSDDDAKSMSDLLTSQNWTVKSRTKGSVGDTVYQPTKDQLNTDIGDLASTIDSDSTVLVYFSGHGTTKNGIAYIVPYLGISDELIPLIDYSKCISPTDLSSMLSLLPTKNVIVLVDTCYSGGFVSSGNSIDASPQNYSSMPTYSAFGTAMSNFGGLLIANASASGAKTPIVVSAAGSIEESFETSSLSHGVFTYYLLEAAAKGDKDGDGIVTTTEAYSYASEAIKSKYDSVFGASFLPHISGDTRDLALFIN